MMPISTAEARLQLGDPWGYRDDLDRYRRFQRRGFRSEELAQLRSKEATAAAKVLDANLIVEFPRW